MLSPTALNDAYHFSLRPLYFELTKADVMHPDKEAVRVAKALIHQAIKYDQALLQSSLLLPFHGQTERNLQAPVTYSSASILDQPWSDHPDQPLAAGEKWNSGRRATNNGMIYALDENGLPVNPYANYGIKERGMIGRYGPNHAVDNGVLRVQRNEKGQYTLFALGITRNDNKQPALCGGFTNFEQDASGAYTYSDEVRTETQALEFFEEMISGSVTLLPEYTTGLQSEIDHHIQAREMVQKQPLTEDECNVIRAAITTHRKVLQVTKEDSGFLHRLQQAFAKAQPCYEGPVISSSRNTNSAWMETRLSYFVMDENKWAEIKGTSRFDYTLAAGDDAGQVIWHEITPDLISRAGSHGAFFSYLLSGYLLTEAWKQPETLPDLKQQTIALSNFLAGKSGVSTTPACKLRA